MRIKNKYHRNRHFQKKQWKRIRNQSRPFETVMPIDNWNPDYLSWHWSTDDQIQSHFEWIEQQARAIENGTHKHWHSAPKHFRKTLNGHRKARVNHVLNKVRRGDYESEFPTFKNDANWQWF
jgi:hypothetical protein